MQTLFMDLAPMTSIHFGVYDSLHNIQHITEGKKISHIVTSAGKILQKDIWYDPNYHRW